MYYFLDLVFSLVMKHAGLFVKPVSLIDKQGMNHITSDFRIHTGAFEHIINAAFLDFSLQLCRIYLPWRAVLRYILYKLVFSCQFCKQPHSNNAFSGSGAAFADNRPFLVILLTFHRKF